MAGQNNTGKVQVDQLIKQVEEKGVEQTAQHYSASRQDKQGEIVNRIQNIKSKYEKLREDESSMGKQAVDEFRGQTVDLRGSSFSVSDLSKAAAKGKEPKKHIKFYLKPYLGEFFGTYLLTIVLVMIVCCGAGAHGPVAPPLAVGLVVAVIIMTYGPVSGGHLNVIVSLAFLMLGEMRPVKFVGYIFAQIFGAAFGAYTGRILIKDSDYAKCCGAQAISPPSTEDWQIILINFIFVFFLILVVCHMYGDKSAWGHAWLPFCVGLYFAVAIFVSHLVGCSMNPSVHLGVAIAAQGLNGTCMKKIGIEDGELEKIGKANWKKFGGKDYWIVPDGKPWMELLYLTIGCVLGSMLAVILYRFVMTMEPRFEWVCGRCKPQYPIEEKDNINESHAKAPTEKN